MSCKFCSLIYLYFYKCPNCEKDKKITWYNVFFKVLIKKNFELCKELLKLIDFSFGCREYEIIVRSGDFELCKLTWNDNLIRENQRYLIIAANIGNLDIIEWLLYDKGPFLHDTINSCFVCAANRNDLTVCKILIQHGADIHHNYDAAFRSAAGNGFMDLCKWMLTLDKINIHAERDMAILDALRSGKLKMCKWLYSLDKFDKDIIKQLINITVTYGYRYCNYDINDWIYHIYVDNHIVIDPNVHNYNIRKIHIIDIKNRIERKKLDYLLVINSNHCLKHEYMYDENIFIMIVFKLLFY